MSKKLTMVDYAMHDQRSCAAMLRGSGDNREQAWITFKKLYPEFNLEVLMEFFSHEARYGRILPGNIWTNHLSRKCYLAFAIGLIVIF